MIKPMPSVKYNVEIDQPPSVVFKMLTDVRSIREWAPVVVKSTCSESEAKKGTLFEVEADLTSVGGPKFHFNNVIAEMVKDGKITWRQTRGPMKELEWLFELNPTEKGTIISLTISYQMPYSILGYVMDKLKMNRVIDSTCKVNLEGLKRKLEAFH